MTPPTWPREKEQLLFHNIWNRGIRKASVFPDPVHAITFTSLWDIKYGMTVSCTGVGDSKPKSFTASKISGISGGTMSLNCFLVDICKKRQRFSERVKEFLLNSSAFQTNKQAHNNNHRCVNLEIPLSTYNPLPDLLPERKHNNWRLSSLYVARMVTKNLLYNPSMSTLLVLNSFRYSMAYPDLSNRNKPKWIHGVRNIDSVRVRENVELVAHISQVLDPLHLVESIIDKSLIE